MRAAQSLSDDRCAYVRVLDVRGLSPVYDYLVLGTGTSGRQLRTAADRVEDVARELGHRPFGGRSERTEQWTAVDLGDVAVHAFSADGRAFYDLDTLWDDAREIEWRGRPV